MLRVRHSRDWVLRIIMIVLLGAIVVFVWWWMSHPLEWTDVSPDPVPQRQAATITSVTSNILVTGNSFWGRYTNDAANRSSHRLAFPFAKLSEFGRDNYDAWLTGLECPTTEKGVLMTSAQMEATLTFNCDPAYLGEFAKWFTAVSLANNHTDNMGADGFIETQKALSAHSVQYFGHYDPEALDDICDVLALPVQVEMSDGETKRGNLPIAMCGHHFVFKLPSESSIQKIAEYAAIMPTIAMPHGGAEYKAAPDDIKTRTMRSMIDAGADMVLGDHAHWVQTTEAYKDRLIVYSMGNFMFDQQFNQEVVRSAAIVVTLKIDTVDAGLLQQWLELGEACRAYDDDCLEQATEHGLEKLTPVYEFDVIATDNSGYQVKPAPELMPWLKQRLRWVETMQALGQ